jgi:putative ABC transport system substrate-binding protein
LAAVAWPAHGQAGAHRVAWFTSGDRRSTDGYLKALREGLRDLGYREGRNLVLEVHAAEFSVEREDRIAAELVALRPAVIVTQGRAARVMSRQPATVPVVFGFSGDPIDAGLAASLARPGRNQTGIAFLALDLVAKRIEILREVLPGLRRIAIIASPDHAGEHRELATSRAAADRLGIEIAYQPARDVAELGASLAHARAAHADALVVFPDHLTAARRSDIVAFALEHRLPAISGWSLFVDAGLLLSYGPNLRDTWYRVASYVDRVIKGANPAELPIELPRSVEMALNLRTARTLGLQIPQSILARADKTVG